MTVDLILKMDEKSCGMRLHMVSALLLSIPAFVFLVT